MRTDDEFPDTGEGEFAIGFGDAPIEVRIDATAAVNQSLADAGQALTDVRTGILAEIDQAICECRNIFGQCIDCATGSIDLLTDQARQTADGIRGRLIASIDQGIDLAGAQLINLFSELPGAAGLVGLGQDETTPITSESSPPDYSFLAKAGEAYRAILSSPREPGGSEDATDTPAPVIVADDQGDELPDQGGGGGGSTSPGGGGGGGGGCSTCPPGWTLGSKLDPDTGDQIPWCFNPFGGPGQAPTCGPPTGGGDCVTVNGQEVCEPTCPGEGDDTIPTDLPPVDETWEVGCGAAYELCKSNCTNAGGTWEDDPGGNSGTCTLPDNGSGVSPFRCKIPSNAPPACFPDRKSAEAFVEAQKALGKDFWVTGTGTQVRGMGGIQIPIDKSCGAAPGCNDCAPGEMNPPENEAAVPEGGEQRGYICNPDNYGLYGDNIVTGGEYSQRIQDYMAWRVGDAASEAYNSTDTGSIISRSLLWAATAFLAPAIGFIGALSSMLVKLFPRVAGCQDEKADSARQKLAFVTGVQRWFGVMDPSLIQSMVYESNFFCQMQIPSPQALTAAYRAGTLDNDQWEFGMKLNGQCLPWAEKIYESTAPLVPVNFVFGWNRAEFLDDDETRERLRRYGIHGDQAIRDFKLANEYLPAPSDIVRFMVRDTFDEEVVSELGYDDDFDKKFTAQAKEWCDRQNIPTDVMRQFWRSHWDIPSNTQLYDMLHRLRPEKNLVDEDGNPLAVDYAQVLRALQINDVAPEFAQRLVELSYRVPGIRQIAKAYETGAIDLDQALSLYQDNGYDKTTSEYLVNYLRVDSAERRAKAQGLVSPAEMEKAFRAGAVGRDQFVQALLDANIPTDVAVQRVNAAELRNTVADMTVRIQNVRKSYLRGAIDSQQYLRKLLAAGVDQPRATAIVDRDQDVLASRNKAVTLAQACKLVGQGYLSLADYRQRALNLGYTDLDALLLASSCNADHQERLQKTLAANQRRAVQEAEKAARAAEKDRRAKKRLYLEGLTCKPKGKPSCPGPVIVPSDVAGMTIG